MNLVQSSIKYKESAAVWQTINGINRKKNPTKAKFKATNEKNVEKSLSKSPWQTYRHH